MQITHNIDKNGITIRSVFFMAVSTSMKYIQETVSITNISDKKYQHKSVCFVTN